MAEWEVTRPDGSTYIVTTSDDATEQDVQNYVADHFRTAAAPTPEDDKDLSGNWFGRNFGAPIARGWNMLEIAGAVMANEAGIFSDEEMAESVAEDVVDMNKIYMGEDVAEGMRAIGESKGWIDSAVAIFQNPEAIADTVIQSLVSSIPSLAGMVVGMKAGALAGSVVPVYGTVVGGIAGAATGTAMGSFAVEYSNALISAMVKAGVNTSDPLAVAAFLNDPVQLAKAKEFAVKRGASVAAFDALSAGIASRIFSPVAKALSGSQRVAAATKLGREAGEATRAAMARGAIVPDEKIARAAARDAAKAVTRSLPVGARVAAGTTELAAQMAAGAAGEASAQVATEGEITSPGEVILEGIAEGPIGIAETAIGFRGPRIAPEPLAPGEFLTPPTPLSRDQYDQPIEGDPIVFAEEQAVNFAYDTPVSMAGGVPSTDQDDYNVVPFDGTNEQGESFSGWRVETSTGIPVTPVIANEETAYAARESFANTLDNVIAEQEQLELNDRVNRAMGGEEQAERAPDLAGLAAGADAGTTVAYNDLSAAHKKKIDGWRINNRSIAPFLPEGRVAVEELSGAGIRESSIDKYLPDAPETPVTPATIKQIATAKNIETSDDAFQKFAARVAGTSKTQAGSWETMGESQLAAIKKRLDRFDRIPADENQKHSIPVTEHRPFSGAQYRSVVAHARRQAARDTTYRVERNGKAVDGGTGFNTEREARRFAESLPSRKGVKIKGVKMKAPLREGEILKSEVKRVLGVKKATNTDAILDAAVERGDLIKVRGAPRGRYRVAEYEIREAQPLMPGLQDRLEARLRGLGIGTKRVSLELVEGLEGPKGVYVDKVIQLALDKLPENATQEEALEILGETMDHETVHALFELGVLTVPEKESLYRFARGARVPRAKGEKGRRLTYFDVAFARYSGLPEYQKTDTEGNLVLDDDGNPEPNFESIMEEGVAEAFRDYAAGRLKPQAQVRTIFSRIVNFFRRMTTLSPADAQYFLMTFSPAREGQYRDSGRGRRPTGMQRDVDVPEGSPGMGRPSRPLARYALDEIAGQRVAPGADTLRSEIVINLSASTPTIKGLDTLTAEANAGDQSALVLLQEIAGDSLRYLTDNISSAEISFTPAYGLYGGQLEPSLGVVMSFQEPDREMALSSVARFATNFNQEQAHVRGVRQPRTGVPYIYEDGSYNTEVIRWNLKKPLTKKEVEKVIKDSGLFGLTVTDQYVEVYFVGDTTNANTFADFVAATQRARESLGGAVQNTRRSIEHLWAYGTGDGATNGYSDIQGEFRPPTGDRASATALRIATRLANRIFQPSQQELTITPEKRALQRRIAESFDAMDMNALDDPAVFRAYEELALEVAAQYDALPIKVEVWKKKGEPYGGKEMSASMRRDVLTNNHLYIYGTEVGTFGPPDVSYENHPMLGDSGRVDINGEPLLFNDLLRAVHDYYAHTMSPVTFGPRGEEAAWRNHMLMTNSPWARWALTSETRGQNSWVNFRKGVEKLPLRERRFSDQKVNLLPMEFVETGDVVVDASLAELPERRARYSLEEDRMLDRIERKRERARQRKAAEEERGFQNVFNGFTNIQPDAFAPIKIYNGGVTPLVVDGKQYPVVMTLGHNQWNDEKQKYVGWGERHAIDHLPDILENTSYKSVDEFVSGVLNMYHANRVEGTLKEANISVFESNDYSDNIRGPKIVIRWKNLADPNWPYPATLVLQVMDFSGMEVKIPELKGKSFASVTTGYALPALDKALEPRPMVALNPDASPMAKGAAGEAKPNEKIDRKLSKKYSLDGRENLPDDYKAPYEKVFGSAPRGPQRSLGEAILNMFSYQDIMTKPSRLRHMIVDVWEPVSAAERTLRKTMPDLYNDIYADSSASAMLSMLGRAAGLTQQYMTVGGIMYTRGMFVAINDRIAANAPPELRDIKQRELADFKARNGYAPDEEVKGLMQIFEPLVELQRVGGYEAWQLYGAARRAQRLLAEGRERLLSDEDIKKGLAIAEDTRFFKDGESVIVKVYEDYQKLNNSLISMMQDANLISPEAATLWRDNGDYMPFYRELYVDDTREGGLDGNVTYQNQENNDQDKIRQAADDPNNRVFDNLYNVKAPPQLKGGRMTYFVMVGNTRASPRVFDTIQKAYVERDRLRALNPDMNPSDIDVKSGTQRIRGEKDPLENILRNANAAITGSMRNVGLLRALRDQVRLGMASKMDSGAVRKSEGSPVWNQLGVRVKGETVWYETTDRLLLNSVQATGDLQQHPIFMSLMTVPANVLRELITKSPDFMLANLIRDTVTAWVTSGTNVTPVVGTINGFARALGGSHLAANVAASGITGGFDFKSDPLDISKSMRKYMKRGVRGAGSAKDYLTKGFLPTLRSPLNPVLKLWQFADDITTASDMATRIAVYNKVLRETGSEAQASLEALEVINFSRKGASSTIQYLTAVVPFLNARLQGLDVLWRGASDRGITGHDVQQRKKRYIFRMLTLVALSTAYAMAHSDDPEEDPYYANATAEKKDMYWIIRPEWLGLSPFSIAVPKIPIAFEVGLITKTIPERIVRLLRGQDDLDDTMGSFGRAFVGTLNFNPVPQFIKPLAEAAINLNTYTWRPIVPYYSLTDAPELASAGIGQTSKEIAKVTGVSAEKVQHILRGYTGTLGMYALQAADAISRSLAGTAEAPDFNVHQYPFFQRFMQSKWGGGDKQEFYALRGRLEELTNNISGFEKMGDFEEADKRKRKHPVLYENKARINHIEKILNNLRRERESIIRDRYTPSDQKKKMINTILQLESEALSGIKKLSIESRR